MLRRIALYGSAAQVAFWLFFAIFIAWSANPRGDGMEWLAMVPATLILLGLVLPALLLSVLGRLSVAAAVLAGAGAVLNAFLFVQILGELHPHLR